MKLATTFASIITIFAISSAHCQVPDEAEVLRKRDWDGMMKIAIAAQKSGDTDLAKRKFLEAWNFASHCAIYNPANRDSGSNRAQALAGMQAIRTAGAGLGLDDTFRQLDAIRAENPPKVFSGGQQNTGWWHVERDEFFTLKQDGSRVAGTAEIITGKGESIVFKFEGREFNGTTMQVELTVVGDPRNARLVGQLTLNGNRLSGQLKNTLGGGPIEWGITRAWKE